MNEPARVSLARRLPFLTLEYGTQNASISGIKFNLDNLTEWNTFSRDIHNALQTVDLDVMVPVDVKTDKYIIGSELGLTGRFTKHVCDPVVNALIAVRVPLRFADRQAIPPPATMIADIVLSKRDVTPPSVIMVIELKTLWTFDLDACITSPLDQMLLTHIEPHIGQLVAQMRESSAIYGVLSTYQATVFLRRDSDTKFSISQPALRHRAGSPAMPSVKQCVMGLALLANSTAPYVEAPGFRGQEAY
ncbi:hypothetical protein N7495_005167 [Penicillium taxi]|uniref:uncharacterized protein n=1 Tax=Penicillium taxi TaxID=168475 RepID=UPI002545062F|nr:uncharacterized protein N7495_005167 [Penicillium taxi]KAJ5893476.1 hypothetical protein N7495_005167 [Penicillium taxi]